MRPELPTASCVRRKRRPPPWTTLHLFNRAPSHLSIGVWLFRSTEPLLDEGINTDVASTNVAIEAVLVAQYQRARVILEDNQEIFLKLVKALMDNGELAADRVSEWVGLKVGPRRDVLENYDEKLVAFVQCAAANGADIQRRA